MPTTRLAVTPAEIAAALRRAADDIAAMGDVELAPTAVTIDLQAVAHTSTPADRIATVDALSVALVGVPGEQNDDEGSPLHRVPFAVRSRRDLDVAVYTSVKDAACHTGGAR